MNIKAYMCINDCGDGSSDVTFHRNMAEAEAQAEAGLIYGPMGEADERHFTVVDGVLCPVRGFDEVEEDDA